MSTSTWALGNWTIGDKLGEGSAGEVYRASRPGGIQGALKLYHNRDPDFVTRSLSALRQLARVRHPNLTEVLDAAVIEPTGEPVPIPGLTEPGTLYLVSRLVEGRTLEALLEQGPLSRGDAIALVAAVGAALDALHRSGLVHRDIKPTNVIVPEIGGPPAAVLVDLGLAGVVDQSTRLTRSGEVFGTPGYMSPEQALGRPQSSASDVWALAALYYRLRFGQAPFEREGVLQTLAAVATEKVRFPDGEAIDPADRQALERALEPDPEQRFPTAQAFVEALRPPAGARPAAPPPAVTPAGGQGPGPAIALPLEAELRPAGRRIGRPAAGAVGGDHRRQARPAGSRPPWWARPWPSGPGCCCRAGRPASSSNAACIRGGCRACGDPAGGS